MVGGSHKRAFAIAPAIICVLFAAMVLAGGSTADGVLGQFDFTRSAANLVDAKGLSTPHAIAIDASAMPNRVYVADVGNNRVLGWKNAAAFANGAPADLVIGQPDFISYGCVAATASSLCAPTAAAVDASGNLYVADLDNSRVLEYTNPFAACGGVFPCLGGPAHLVFGQGGSFSTRQCDGDAAGINSTANDLCDPTGVALDNSGNLYVADSGNERVLKYNTPLTTDTTADTVFGQGGDFTSNDCNFDTAGGNPTAHDLCDPTAVALDASGNLYVADTINERVLEYSTPFGSTPSAHEVLGQSGSFITSDCDGDTMAIGSSADDLCDPIGVAVDGSGHLYVADTSNNRVVEYNAPLTSTTANVVFGQGGDFTSNVCNFDIAIVGSNIVGSTGDDLCLPMGVAADPTGDLFVADGGNSRVLKYNTPLTTDTTADAVLGQLDLTHQMLNLTDAQGLWNPQAVAIDASVMPNRLYVADFNNSRVLGWKNTGSFANGAPADLVIGQPDFLSYFCNGASATETSAGSLCFPEGVAVDGSGNLYVADTDNSRVLEYANPFSACNNTFPCVGGPAIVVLGQGNSFATGVPNEGGLGPAGLDSPEGVAVDSSGNVFVADSSNNRVLEFNAPLTNGASAAQVFGQGGSFTSSVCNFDTGGSFLSPSSAIDLCDPSGIALDATGNLYVSDLNNHRVLEYNTPLNAGSGQAGPGDTTADTVFGQGGSFTSKICARGNSGMCVPMGLAVDGVDDLYVTDGNRVLEYNTPLTTDTIADRVFGTCGSFTFSTCIGVSANSLNDPTGVAVDNAGRLFVADNHDNRVIEYAQPLMPPSPTPTATPTSTPTATASSTSTPSATPTATPTGPGHISINRKTLSLSAAPGATASASITISDTGTGTLTANVTAPRHSPILIEVGGGNGIVIGPGEMHVVTIVFSPLTKGSTKDLIVITSNDPKKKKPFKVKIRAKSN